MQAKRIKHLRDDEKLHVFPDLQYKSAIFT